MKKWFWLLCLFLLLINAAPALADNTPTNITLSDGTSVYGYWDSAGNIHFVVECDPSTNKETGQAWVNNPVTTTTSTQVVTGYTTTTGTQKHIVASTEIVDEPLWKGTMGIPPLYSNNTPIQISSPYSNPPDYWRWIIFDVTNPNSWPIISYVNTNITGDSFHGEVYFKANETKQIRLRIGGSSSTVPSYGFLDSGRPVVYGGVDKNLDPDAPTSPVDYVDAPPADDGTGEAWGANQFDDVELTTSATRHWSQGLWSLVPAFKEVPTWTPTTNDSYWGTISFQPVPAYQWTIISPAPSIYSDSWLCGSLSSNISCPYFVGGSFGSWQPSNPGGNAAPQAYWTQTVYNNKIDSGTGAIPDNKYPNRSLIYSYWGNYVYYTDSSKNSVIYLSGSSWYVFSQVSSQNGVCNYGDTTHDKNTCDYSYSGVTVYTSVHGYCPLYGSYGQVGTSGSFTYSYPATGDTPSDWVDANGNVDVTVNYRNYNMYNYFYNPMPYTTTLTFTDGYIDSGGDDATYTLDQNTGGYDPKSYTITIPPYSYGVIPVTYQYIGNSMNPSYIGTYSQGTVFPLWYYAVGYTATNIRCNAVAYDNGEVDGSGTSNSVSNGNFPPTVNGCFIDQEDIMTTTDLQQFYWSDKVQQVINNSDHQTFWNMASKVRAVWQHDTGGGGSMDYETSVQLTP